jgi:prepilin-type N-terminal cleavage/methylation domain-containing protein
VDGDVVTAARHAVAFIRSRLGARDAGITLIEVVVSMTIMAIIMVIFSSSVTRMFGAANRTESQSVAQSQINTLFLRLDKEIRYASGISLPKDVSGTWYAEYLTTNTGTALCTQLRLTPTGTLSRRTWVKKESAAPEPTPWTPLAEGVAAPAGGQPFTLLAADATSNFHRLRVTLTAAAGAGASATARDTTITFTALNTSLSTTSSATCTEGRSIP